MMYTLFIPTRDILCELWVGAPAKYHDVAHHDDGSGVPVQSTVNERGWR